MSIDVLIQNAISVSLITQPLKEASVRTVPQAMKFHQSDASRAAGMAIKTQERSVMTVTPEAGTDVPAPARWRQGTSVFSSLQFADLYAQMES